MNFKAMPVIIFFSSIVNFLYYIGAIQYIILKISWIVNKIMATSPTESMNATANIFLGQNEAPLLIKPFLPKMTTSEIFAVMVVSSLNFIIIIN
jgi:nucleoside permease NupC